MSQRRQRGFKDGTRDYRIFAGLYAFSRFLYIWGKNGNVMIGLIFLIFGVLVIGCHPYQRMMLDFFILVTISTSTLIFYLATISSVVTKPILFLIPVFLLLTIGVYAIIYIRILDNGKEVILIN